MELLISDTVVASGEEQKADDAVRVLQPEVVRRQALSVTEGGAVTITGEKLFAMTKIFPHAEMEHELPEVEYVISVEPSRGELERRQHNTEHWRRLRTGDTFLQSHIDQHLIR